MTRGARNQAVTVRLREELKEASAARARLERRLVETEKALAKATTWIDRAQADAVPAVLEARERERVANQRAEDATRQERECWLEHQRAAKPFLDLMMKADVRWLPDVNTKAGADVFVHMQELLGPSFTDGIAAHGRRETRRTLASAGRLKSKAKLMQDAIDNRGVDLQKVLDS